MKVGDLVRWRHPSETDIGIVVVVGASVYIHWSNGDHRWEYPTNLEVICK